MTSTSILRNWVMELPIRYQGVLLAAIRGPDGQPRGCSAKPLVRALRYAVMHPADEDEVGLPSAFMQWGFTDAELRAFCSDWDHYHVHFIQHLMHAFQVIGACHPRKQDRNLFRTAYLAMVRKLHLEPESDESMRARLTEDRIGTHGNASGEDVVDYAKTAA